jgi:dihydrofolate reductase
MRKIIVSIHSSFNGVVTGPKNDETNFMTWAQQGIEDIVPSFHENFETVDTILLGRGTYEDLSTKWPFVKDWPDVDDVALRLGDIINNTRKVVVAGNREIDDIKWGDFAAPAQLVGNDIEQQIKALKEHEGGDIITFGSPILVQSLTNANLVDEYRILVHPVIVGEGRHLFSNIEGRKDLRLKSAKTFGHGAILVQYELVTDTRP